MDSLWKAVPHLDFRRGLKLHSIDVVRYIGANLGFALNRAPCRILTRKPKTETLPGAPAGNLAALAY